MILALNGNSAFRKLAALLLVLITSALYVSGATADEGKRKNQKLGFDIAENGSRFVFDSEPVDEDGLPAYGGEFVTEGYLYPHGFLETNAGVNEDGTAAFPGQVIGRWTCRGWHLGEGAQTITGPWVITNQYFDLGETFGEHSLTTEGYELVDMNTPVSRAVTGGTGKFKRVRGESSQVFLGFNPSFGVKLRVTFQSIRDAAHKKEVPH